MYSFATDYSITVDRSSKSYSEVVSIALVVILIKSGLGVILFAYDTGSTSLMNLDSSNLISSSVNTSTSRITLSDTIYSFEYASLIIGLQLLLLCCLTRLLKSLV